MVQPHCSDAHTRESDLSEVRLLEGPVKARQDRNGRYLLALDCDRLLHNFRVNAGLASTATPLGGWEAPTCGLRGHFVGHYLSACAQAFGSTGDVAFAQRAGSIVEGLAACQKGSGHLSAFPESDLDAIETRFEGAWASYYVLHKLLAGLLDVHRYCDGPQALEVAIRLADYIVGRIAALSPQQIAGMCRTDRPNPTNEFGGIEQPLLDLYALTGKAQYLDTARVFEPAWFVAPLAGGEDRLSGLHANTHIPIVLGMVRRGQLTGDTSVWPMAGYFWERTAIARSYANGGSSGPRPDGKEKSTGGEHWPEPFMLAHTLTPKINESCVTHNMMHLTAMLFCRTGESRYADFYERAYFNSVLCMQHPGRLGGYIYGHPLGSRSRKEFGHADDTFWCCYGTGVEAFARLAQRIYFHSDDGRELWVNLAVPAELNWRGRGVRIEQQTQFPTEPGSRLVFHCDRRFDLTIHVHIPAGCAAGIVTLNGRAVRAESSDGYVTLQHEWVDGDVLDITYVMSLRCEAMPDDPRCVAVFYGPVLLAARTDEELLLAATDRESAIAQVRQTGPIRFTIGLAGGAMVELVPLNEIVEETFGVYFQLR